MNENESENERVRTRTRVNENEGEPEQMPGQAAHPVDSLLHTACVPVRTGAFVQLN